MVTAISALWGESREEGNVNVAVRLERSAKQADAELWVVTRGGAEVGFVTKCKRAKGFHHPWKAFRGIGFAAEYLGSFYPREGGKNAAILAVVGRQG